MAEYESRKVRGWRSLLEDAAASARERICAAPAWVVYIEGIESCSSDQLLGSTKWFSRVFGPERAIACADLEKIQQLKRQIRKAEMTIDQLEAMRADGRQAYHRRKAKQTNEERLAQLEKKRNKRALRTPEEIEKERAWFREFRARQTSEWRDLQNTNANRRRAENSERYRLTAQRFRERARDKINERRRTYRQTNLDEIRRRERVYYLANREQIRAYVLTWRAKKKSNKTAHE